MDTSQACRGAGSPPLPSAVGLVPASHVLSWAAVQLDILASDLSEVPVRDRGGDNGGWREALEALYETIAACESLDVRDAWAAMDLCVSAFRLCDVLRAGLVLAVAGTLAELLAELEAAEDAIVADAKVRVEAERRIASWARGDGPVLRCAAVAR